MRKVILVFLASVLYYVIWQRFIYSPTERLYDDIQQPIISLEVIEYDEVSKIQHPIPREQIFLSLQKILSTLSDNSAENIFLNTKISNILKNESSNQDFEDTLYAIFFLPKEIIKKGLNENIIVWDWINSISNYQKSLIADIEY